MLKSRKLIRPKLLVLLISFCIVLWLVVYAFTPASYAAMENLHRTYRQKQTSDVLEQTLITTLQKATRNTIFLSSTSDFENLIRFQCIKLACNAEQIIRIMYCESGGAPYAQNGVHKGIFQHNERFWPARARQYNVANYDIFDPYAQIIVTTNMFADGLSSHWECK